MLRPITSFPLALACAFLCAFAAIPATIAASQKMSAHRRARPKPAPKPVEDSCAPGVVLKLSAPESSQGSLLLLELRSAKPLAQVSASWTEKQIPFWQEHRPEQDQNASGTAPGANPPDVWHALLGVDLELKAGDYPLTLAAKSAGSSSEDSTQNITCTAHIAVEQGKFATESLRVAPNFVEPNPEQLARAEAETQRLRAIFATITPERLWQGPFSVPLEGVTTGGNFGKRRVLNGTPRSPHGGVDFPVPAGTPVYAPQRGRVVLAEELYFSGNTVILDHGLGLYTFYGHLESIDAKPGDLLDTGALLGKVGATGRVTGPHLHWQLSLNRSRVNPLQLVSLPAF